MPLDQQCADVLKQMNAGPPIESLTVREARLAGFAYLQMQSEPEPVEEVVHRYLPGPTADLPVRIYYPRGAARGKRGALVLFHGSGWVSCNLDVNDVPARALANRSGCVVIAVNYQKAPEHPFPAPLDDCYATLLWVRDNADQLRIDPARIAVGGDSAGGNLAAAVCLKARDEAGPAIAFQLLIYPPLIADTNSATYQEFATGYGVQRTSFEWFWGHYVGSADPRNPLISPLLAEDVAGLPPTFIASAECDPVREDGERYARRLHDAGVPVVLTRYDGMIHGFYLMDGLVSRARDLFEDAGARLRAAVGE